jgi:molybdopterin/thiamine biosynthesis adenylyltransferase
MSLLLSEKELYQALWARTALVLTDEDRLKLKASTVCVNGLGSVGGIVVEELVRSGVGNLKLVDPNVFETTSLGSELYATIKTIGRKKAEVAMERVHEINPYCQVETYTDGIKKANIFKILQGTDVVVDALDQMSRRIIQHRAAKKMGIPLVHGCRAGFPGERWTIQVWVWNYRNNPFMESREEEEDLWTSNLTWDELTDDVLNSVDQQIASSMKRKIRTEIIKGNIASFGNVPLEYLLSQLDGDIKEPYQDNLLHKRTVSVQVPNTAGILVSLEAVKIILGWRSTTYKLNLIKGKMESVSDVLPRQQPIANRNNTVLSFDDGR